MRVKLLGYLSYVAGGDSFELRDVKSVEEAIRRLSNLAGIEGLIFHEKGLWEGVVLILNGELISELNVPVKDDDELVITLPTAGG